MEVDRSTLAALVLAFAPLSLVSIGGGPAVVSDMQHQAVVVHGWMTQRQFAELFAISRAAPGPGALLVTLVGWKAAGWVGAVVASLAFFGPPCLLIYGAVHLSRRWPTSAWGHALEAGLAPIGVGLMFAGAYAILGSESMGLLGWVVALCAAAGRLWRPNLHPVAVLGLGAVVIVLTAG